MQSRYRSPRDGFRHSSTVPSGGRIPPSGRDLGRGPPNPYPSPRKVDIFMEAGRLAAEYLVSRGVLPPEILTGKFPNGSPPGFEQQASETPPPLPEGRTSALARLGHRFDDESRFNSRRRWKSKKRTGPYGRVYDSDWGREHGRSRNWMETGRGYSDIAEEEDEFAPGFYRNRRNNYVEIKSSVSRVSADEQLTRSESVSEKENCEFADDTGSKASSSSTKKDQQLEVDEGSSRGVDDIKVSSSEITDEVKSERADEPEKEESMEDVNDMPCVDEGDVEMKDCKDLLKICSIKKVPTRPRSSLANKIPKVDQGRDAEKKSSTFEVAVEEESKDLKSIENISSEMHSPENHCIQPAKSMEEPVGLQNESFQRPLDLGTSTYSLNEKQDDGFESNVDESEKTNNSCPSPIPEEIENTKDTHFDGKITRDEEMVEETNDLDSSTFIRKNKAESTVILDEELGHQRSSSFKICDLNLSGSPEVTENPFGPCRDHFPSAPRVDMGKSVSADFSMPMRNDVDDSCNNSRLSDHNKVVPVIDLEEDSHAEISTVDPPKNKNDISYPALENVLNQATHADDLHGIQDSYSLEFSEFLGPDISGCPSAQGDINNLQPGIGFHGAEGYPGVDDHIYVSLEEIPIGFMGVWDQQPQDYEKFF